MLWFATRFGHTGSCTVSAAASPESRSEFKALRLLPGLFVFLDQFCSLTGVKLADPGTASAWQPSQAVFTMVICACCGLERMSIRKVMGTLCTVGGALLLVLLSREEDHGSRAALERQQLGQLFFLGNCLASSSGVIVWHQLLEVSSSSLSHLSVTAEGYLVASCLMVTTCLVSSRCPAAVEFFCPECHGNVWHMPEGAVLAVAYSVVFQTITAYALQAWALKYAESSAVSLYASAQPLMGNGLVCLMLVMGLNPGGVFRWPGLELLGAPLIILGLVLSSPGIGGFFRSQQVVDNSIERSDESSNADPRAVRTGDSGPLLEVA
eukprot:gnl/TRDRNA2_/TRDRNA2_129672_c1_seq2.p1 gnl/TRDRNA2_/TRDRNA2_129672_c1~~gnl/TRDRNA2_/TRDRNA2_129672_c1_seq2.p1  ORF type:complete len:323 (+),score=46.37 gnl/TRDRNA2_/TRDRNA2_129672_c1_seq2:67-1035(+)